MELSNVEIQKIIPHRYPFLLVDKILDYEPGVFATGVKAVTATEYYFQGHFPDYPVMPGVLVVEGLAQTGAVCGLTLPDFKGGLAFFGGIDNFRFKRQVYPGDLLRYEIKMESFKVGIFKCSAIALVGSDIAANGTLMAVLKKAEK